MQDYSTKISSIELVNYKKFADTTVNFDPSLTVFSGKNGAGKSSVLSGVMLTLSWIIARLRNDSGVGSYVAPSDVRNNATGGCVTSAIFGGTATIPSKAKAGFAKEFNLNISPIKEYAAMKRQQLAGNQPEACLPVFAYFGVKRAVLDMPLRTRRQDYSMFDAYDKSLEGAANFRGFFTWFRACEDWENQETVRRGIRVEHPGLRAFRQAMEKFMPGYRNICIERHPLGMMLEKDGERLNAEQLSDGEKIYLALIGDLCHRLSLANPGGDPLLGEGIVLIDEIDLHLHPQWQSEIANALTSTFPNIQFIVSTHSPHVINSVPTSSLRLIEPDGTITTPAYGYGMPSEIVLGDLMALSSDVPLHISAIIGNFTEAIADRKTDEARKLLQALKDEVPNHPDLPRMRKQVERLMR